MVTMAAPKEKEMFSAQAQLCKFVIKHLSFQSFMCKMQKKLLL